MICVADNWNSHTYNVSFGILKKVALSILWLQNSFDPDRPRCRPCIQWQIHCNWFCKLATTLSFGIAARKLEQYCTFYPIPVLLFFKRFSHIFLHLFNIHSTIVDVGTNWCGGGHSMPSDKIFLNSCWWPSKLNFYFCLTSLFLLSTYYRKCMLAR